MINVIFKKVSYTVFCWESKFSQKGGSMKDKLQNRNLSTKFTKTVFPICSDARKIRSATLRINGRDKKSSIERKVLISGVDAE